MDVEYASTYLNTISLRPINVEDIGKQRLKITRTGGKQTIPGQDYLSLNIVCDEKGSTDCKTDGILPIFEEELKVQTKKIGEPWSFSLPAYYDPLGQKVRL